MTDRRKFIVGTAAFAITPAFADGGRAMKTPLMLDTNRGLYGE